MIVDGVKVLPVEVKDLADYCERQKRAIESDKKSKAAKAYRKYKALIKKGVARDQAFKLAAGAKPSWEGAGTCQTKKK